MRKRHSAFLPAVMIVVGARKKCGCYTLHGKETLCLACTPKPEPDAETIARDEKRARLFAASHPPVLVEHLDAYEIIQAPCGCQYGFDETNGNSFVQFHGCSEHPWQRGYTSIPASWCTDCRHSFWFHQPITPGDGVFTIYRTLVVWCARH